MVTESTALFFFERCQTKILNIRSEVSHTTHRDQRLRIPSPPPMWKALWLLRLSVNAKRRSGCINSTALPVTLRHSQFLTLIISKSSTGRAFPKFIYGLSTNLDVCFLLLLTALLLFCRHRYLMTSRLLNCPGIHTLSICSQLCFPQSTVALHYTFRRIFSIWRHVMTTHSRNVCLAVKYLQSTQFTGTWAI